MTSDRESKPHDPLQQIRYQVADAVGGLMELWGFKRIMGRTWTLLYLADAPLSAADLGDALQVSPGSVSMTVGDLLKWGVVRKTWVPGDRRDFYLPETSVWKMVSRVIRERELVQVSETNDRLADAQRSLAELVEPPKAGEPAGGAPQTDGASLGSDEKSRAALHHLQGRIHALHHLGQFGQLFIEQLLSGRSVDLLGLQAALNLVTPAGSDGHDETPPGADGNRG